MVAQVIALLLVGMLGIITFQIVRSTATTLCYNTTGWSQTEITLVCEIIGTAIAMAIVVLVFVILAKAAKGIA